MKKINIVRWRSLANSYEVSRGQAEFLTIGPVPNEEACTPAGHDYGAGIMECQVYAELLQRHYGEPPEGAALVIIESVHDEAGIYHEVGIVYDKANEELDYDELTEGQKSLYDRAVEAEQYALKLESGVEKWDNLSLTALREGRHYLHAPKLVAIPKTPVVSIDKNKKKEAK